MKNVDYLHSIIKDLTDVLWEEHGRGARYRTTLVGTEYFDKKYGNQLVKETITDTLDEVFKAMKDEEIVADITYDQEDFVLRVNFGSCAHHETEKQLLASGIINTINCPCANIVMHYVSKITGKYCELSTVDIKENECAATICVMKSQED